MQRRAELLRAAEEDARLGGRVDAPDPLEDGVPVRAAEVGGRAQARDRIGLCVGVVDHNVCCVVRANLGG